MNKKGHCQICGAAITPQAAGGMCPRCLLIQGLISTRQGRGPGLLPPEPTEIQPLYPDLEILELVGFGGMGVVYKARQTKLDRIVALKVLPVQLELDPMLRDRFAREAKALARLGHRNIVRVYEFGEREGMFFLLMEFVEGTDLAHRIRKGRIAPAEALPMVRQICAALEYAHAAGVIHRDIKPGNILISASGEIKVADFGVAKLVEAGPLDVSLTAAGDAVGTPLYMAPEQRETPQGADHRADLYSVGVVLYEMLTGELPTGNFPPPSERADVDKAVDEVVLRALENEPAQRYQRASELRENVERITTQPGGTASVNSVTPAIGRRRWKSLAAAAGVLIVLTAAIGSWFASRPPTPSRPFVNTLGMKFVAMPGTNVWFSVWETRVRDLDLWLRANGMDAPRVPFEQGPDHPALRVSGTDASSFCAWLTKAERAAGRIPARARYRLPTNEEWNIAAGLSPVGKTKPVAPEFRGRGRFANLPDASLQKRFPLAHTIGGYDDGFAASAPVGSFPPNANGLHDMAGNAWEITLEKKSGSLATLRGGSFWCTFHSDDWSGLDPAYEFRAAFGEDGIALDTGFRIVLEREAIDEKVIPKDLWEAASLADVDAANKFIGEGADVNALGVLGCTPLMLAATEGAEPVLDLLLARGANVDAIGLGNDTALSCAAGAGRTGVVKTLLAHGARVEGPAVKMATPPLHAAAAGGSLETARVLVDAGADVNQRDFMEMTPLHLAVGGGSVDLVNFLLDRKADLTARDKTGATPLASAVNSALFSRHDPRRIIELLLQRGADPNRTEASIAPAEKPLWIRIQENTPAAVEIDPLGSDPLWTAARCADADLCELLIARGADPGKKDQAGNTLLHAVGYFGTPQIKEKIAQAFGLMKHPGAATVVGHLDRVLTNSAVLVSGRDAGPLVDLLLKHSLDLEARNTGMGMTALNQAAHSGNLSLVRALVERGAKIDTRDDSKFTPLLSAVESQHRRTVEYLLAHGADVNAKEYRNGNAISLAASGTDVDLASLLLEKGVPFEQNHPSHATPLYDAASAGRPGLVELFLRRGATPDVVISAGNENMDGMTPLHAACITMKVNARLSRLTQSNAALNGQQLADKANPASDEDYTRCVRLLLDAGAKIEARNAGSQTPLHHAVRNDAIESVKLLLARGADMNAADHFGLTPLHWGAADGAVEGVRVLLEHGANINARDTKAATPLHLAVNGGQPEMIKFLLEHGADAGARDFTWSTPLHLAATGKSTEIAQILLDRHADSRALTANGYTAAQIALVYGRAELAELFGAAERGRLRPLDDALAREMFTVIGQTERTGVDPADAEKVTRRVLAALEAGVHDPGEVCIDYTRGLLGRILAMSSRPGEAIEHLQASIKRFGGSPVLRRSPALALEASMLGEACHATQRWADELDALKILRELLEEGTIHFGPAANGATAGFGTQGRVTTDPVKIADVDRRRGLVLEQLGRHSEAETALNKALEQFKKILAESHSLVVDTQDDLERVRRAQGQHPRPRFVGPFGRQERLVFEGNQTFPAEKLHAALMRSSDFILAVHPSGKFDDYLKTLEGCLTRGYLHSGFANPKIHLEHEAARDVVLVRINEGTRCKWGTLKVTGAKSVPNEQLRNRLLQEVKPEETLGARFGRAISSQTQVKGATSQGASALTLPTSRFTDQWKPGDVATLDRASENGLKSFLVYELAKDGFLQAEVTVRHEHRAGGTLETTLEVAEGSRAIISTVNLSGNVDFKSDDILKFLGVSRGMEGKSGLKEGIEGKLAESSRFTRWNVELKPVAAGKPGMQLNIDVTELPGAPQLDVPFTEELQELIKAANWVNFLEKHNADIEIEVEAMVNDKPTRLGHAIWSPSHGMFADFRPPPVSKGGAKGLRRLVLAMTQGRLRGMIETGRGRSLVDSRAPQLNAFLNFLSNRNADGSASESLNVGGGLKSNAHDLPLQLDLFVAPTEILRLASKPGTSIARDGDELTLLSNEAEIIWNTRTQTLKWLRSWTEDFHVVLLPRTGAWTDAEKELNVLDSDKRAGKASLDDWTAVMAQAAPLFADSDDETQKLVRFLSGMGLLFSVAFDDLLPAFEGLFADPTQEDPESFFVPMDPDQTTQMNATTMLFASLWFEMADAFLPKDTWIWNLAREVFYVQAGRTEYTVAALNKIAADPSLGPLGCLVTEKILERFQVPQSLMFRRLALKKLSLENLRKDWALLLSPGSGLSRTAGRFIERLRGLDEGKIKALAGLGAGLEQPLRDAGAQLRARRSEAPEDVMRAFLEKAWLDYLEKELRRSLDQAPGMKPADPALVAARVNGADIMRQEVAEAVGGQRQMLMAAGQALPPDLETQALNALVERELVLLQFQKMGGELKPQVVDDQVQTLVRDNFGGNEEAFKSELEKAGMTLERFKELQRKQMIVQYMKQQAAASAPEPTETEIAAAVGQESGASSRLVHLRTITLPKTAFNSTADSQKRLAEEIRAKAGADFGQLAKTYSQDSSASDGGDRGFVNPGDLADTVASALQKMKKGEVSPVIDLDSEFLILQIEDERAGPVKSADALRETAKAGLKTQKQNQAIESWVKQLRASAYIETFQPLTALGTK